MKHPSLYILLFLTVSGIAAADENPPTKPIVADPPITQDRYLITLAEYRLKNPIATDATESEIIGFIRHQKTEPLETVRLSAIHDAESMAKFGKRVTVTTGKITSRDGTSRQTQQIEIGTILRITIVPHERGTIAAISYTSSRLQGEGTDDSPPDVATTTVDTTQILELGKPRLIGATSADETSYVLVTVAKLP